MSQQVAIDALVRDANRVTRAEIAALAAELRAGGDAAWHAPTRCEGWQARTIAIHLDGAAAFFLMAVDAVLAGGAPPPFNADKAAARDAEMQAKPREQVLDQLEQNVERLGVRLDSLDEAALGRPVDLGFITVKVSDVAFIILNEAAVHAWDVRAPRDSAARVSQAAVSLVLPNFLDTLSLLATGEKEDGTWQIDVQEPACGSLNVQVRDGHLLTARGAAESPDARLTLAGEPFLRLVWGRLDLADAIARGEVQVAGDTERALALQRLFKGA